jgi:hypothetical protein
MEEVEKLDIELEREQLNLLIKRGVKFDVVTKIRKRKKGFNGFFQKPEVLEEVTTYEIHEPTLSVLDRLCDIWLDMALDEEALKEGAVIVEAKKTAKQNAKKMARVIAIAVLGEDYHITEITRTGKVKKYNDDKELNRLTNTFFHAIKPSKLALLSTTVTNVSNLADFITSMRLMSGARTTKPITGRIE